MTWGRTSVLVGAVLLASLSSRGRAQSTVTILPLQPLSFGLLLPGVQETVAVTDVARRAVVALSGSGPIDITLVLPASLDGPGGDRIPLQFSAGDAGLLPSIASAVIPLNAFQVNRVNVDPDRAVHLVVGGVARPSLAHRPGHYAARVVVLVSQPGT